MNENISIDPEICHGQPCIRDTRMPVHLVLTLLANGETVEGLLEDYPSLGRDDILACLQYAAAMICVRSSPVMVASAVA